MNLDQNSTISLGLLVTVIAAIWRISGLASRMESGLSKLADDVRRVENALASLATIPVHESRISQLERIVTDLGVRLDNTSERISDLARRIAVTRERVASMHDDEIGGETDRPPRA